MVGTTFLAGNITRSSTEFRKILIRAVICSECRHWLSFALSLCSLVCRTNIFFFPGWVATYFLWLRTGCGQKEKGCWPFTKWIMDTRSRTEVPHGLLHWGNPKRGSSSSSSVVSLCHSHWNAAINCFVIVLSSFRWSVEEDITCTWQPTFLSNCITSWLEIMDFKSRDESKMLCLI